MFSPGEKTIKILLARIWLPTEPAITCIRNVPSPNASPWKLSFIKNASTFVKAMDTNMNVSMGILETIYFGVSVVDE